MGKENELLEAARVGNINVIDKLLFVKQKNVLTQALSFRRSVSVNCQDGSGYTPLHHAVLNGHCGAVQHLLKYEASPIVPDNNGNTPLHLAAWTGNGAILITLLISGISRAQVNEQNNDLDSHLHFAAQYGHTEVVEILLENGANPDVLNKKDESPLDLASQYGHLEVVNVLLKNEPSLLNKIPGHRSLLHLAARNGHHQVIRKLLECGCDINKKLSNGTALHEAALFGKVEVVRVLLESRPQIDVYAKDNQGETALEKVQGHSSKVAKDISALIKAFSRGEPLPEPSSPVASVCQSSDGDDIEAPSVYDNLPSTGHRTLPLMNRKTRDSNKSYEHVQLDPAAKSSSSGDLNSRENYVNMRFGDKARTPPKKPARVSIGHLLDQLNENGLTEKSSPAYSTSMYEISQGTNNNTGLLMVPEGSNRSSQTQEEQDAGDYAMLRPDAHLVGQPPLRTLTSVEDEPRRLSSVDSQSTGKDSLSEEQPAEPRRKISAPIASIDSDPEGDIEVYELLADAVTGDERSKKTSGVKPIPAPRRNISPCVTNGSTSPEEMPSHPPPSPHTAMLGVQARFSQHKLPDVGASDDDHHQYEQLDTGTHNAPSVVSQHAPLPPTQHFVFQSIAEESRGDDMYSKPVPRTYVTERHSVKRDSETMYSAPSSREQQPYAPERNSKGMPESSTNLSTEQVPLNGSNSSNLSTDQVPLKYSVGSNSKSSVGSKPVPPARLKKPQTTNTRQPVEDVVVPSAQESVTPSVGDSLLKDDEAIDGDSSSCDSDILRPDDVDPFAGLVKGSNHRLHRGSMQEHPLKEMGTDTMDNNGHQTEESGCLDETSEWAQIESIMASFGAGLVRESVYVRDYEMNFQKMLEGKEKPHTVADWLDKLGVGQYLYTLIANGFDNLNFLDSSIMTDQDLKEIGIQDESHRKLLLEAAKCLPKMKSIGDGDVPVPSSITEWLRSLVLSDYIHNFNEKRKTTMEKVRGLWDVELENVLEIHMLGHRKRILASLGDWRLPSNSGAVHSSVTRNSSPRLTSRSAVDLTLDIDAQQQQQHSVPSLTRANSSSLDIDLFKDYSKDVTSPIRIKPVKDVKAWTLPERHRRHHSDIFQRSNTHSEESLQEELYTRSNALTIPKSKTTHEMGTQVTPGIDSNIPDIIRTDSKKTRGLQRQNSSTISTQTTDDMSSASLDVIANTQQQWMHRPDDLVKGCCNYTASYLGSTIVKELQGTESTRLSCIKLRRSASHVQKVPTITLSISYAGVKFIDTKSKKVITEHEICNISCVSQYEEDMKTFAYVTRDETYDRIYCHVFTVKTLDLATEIILTLGQAFELAYQLLVKTHPQPQVPARPLSTETEDTKL